MKRFRRIFFKVILWFFITLFLLIGMGLLLGYLYQDEIKQLFVKELNKKLNTEIKTKEIHFSLIKKFPYASVSMYDVAAKEVVNAAEKENLIEAKAIHLQFNLFDIIDKKLNLHRVEVADGFINIKIFKDGTDNYHFWKADTTDNSETFVLNLKKIILKNVALIYLDNKQKLRFVYHFEKGIFKIMMKDAEQKVYADMQGEVQQFSFQDKRIIPDAALDMDLQLFTPDSWNTLSLKKGKVLYAGFPVIAVDATFSHLNDNFTPVIKLSCAADRAKVQQICAVFFNKEKLPSFFADMQAKVDLQCRIAGEVSKTKIPHVKIDFDLHHASFIEKSRFAEVRDLNARGYYCNKFQDRNNDFLSITSFDFTMFDEKIKGNMKMLNFSKPAIEAACKGKMQLRQIMQLFNMPDYALAVGNVGFDILFSGAFHSFPNISNKDFLKSKIQGTVAIENIAFPVKQQVVLRNGNANFKFNNTHLFTENFTGEYGSCKFELNGYFKNLFSNLFTEDKQIVVDCDFKTDFLNVAEFIVSDSTKSSGHIVLPDDVIFKLHSNIKTLQFNDFGATEVSGLLRYKNKQLVVENVKGKAFDGNIEISGLVDGSNGNKFVMQSQSKLTHINMEKLFRVMHNFNQQQITSQHLKGFASINLTLNSEWDQRLHADLNKLAVNADIAIDKGELIKLQLLQKLSRFVKVEDLEHVYFEHMQNQIQIFDRKIVIPEMHVQSNALDFWVSGTHHFDNTIDYNVRILLSDLLFNKARKNKQENEAFAMVEDDGYGKTSLYIKITGTADNPHFSYNRKAVAKKILDDIKKEQQNIKEILKKEFFPWMHRDSVQLRKEKQQLQQQEEGKFVIEWDEE